MHLIFQILIIFTFIVIFYAVVIIALIDVPINGMTGSQETDKKLVRFKNIISGRYLALEAETPILVNSDNIRDPATLFQINYQDGYIQLQSIYNDRFLAVINGEITSVTSRSEDTNFSLLFNSEVQIIPISGGFLSANAINELIISDFPNDNSQWRLESVTSFL